MKRFLIASILVVIGSWGAFAQTRNSQGEQSIDKERFANPRNEDRIYMLQHDTRGDFKTLIGNLNSVGFGGIVTNADWHTGKSDPDFYLGKDEDFDRLDEVIR